MVILRMPALQFQQSGAHSFSSSNEQGFVTVAPFGGAHGFEINFDRPEFPPGFTLDVKLEYFLCLNIGDDGVFDRIVCQPKPGGGFLCHE